MKNAWDPGALQLIGSKSSFLGSSMLRQEANLEGLKLSPKWNVEVFLTGTPAACSGGTP